jgi:hypothetical protein
MLKTVLNTLGVIIAFVYVTLTSVVVIDHFMFKQESRSYRAALETSIANALTRTHNVFGQALLNAHPENRDAIIRELEKLTIRRQEEEKK